MTTIKDNTEGFGSLYRLTYLEDATESHSQKLETITIPHFPIDATVIEKFPPNTK